MPTVAQWGQVLIERLEAQPLSEREEMLDLASLNRHDTLELLKTQPEIPFHWGFVSEVLTRG